VIEAIALSDSFNGQGFALLVCGRYGEVWSVGEDSTEANEWSYVMSWESMYIIYDGSSRCSLRFY